MHEFIVTVEMAGKAFSAPPVAEGESKWYFKQGTPLVFGMANDDGTPKVATAVTWERWNGS